MKNFYTKIVKYFASFLVFILDKTMRHLVLLSDKKINENVSDNLDFETRLKSVSEYMKSPTHTFGNLFSRVGEDVPTDTGKGITIQIPRVILSKKDSTVGIDK